MSTARTEQAPTRAIIYLRQSVYREESISLELQEHACREYCERKGYRVVAVESDPGISGRTWSKRPKVQQVMSMIESDAADVIVLWKWSRLSRNRAHWAVAADRVDVAGGRIESATEPLDTATASGRFARGVMTEYAAFQSEQIGEQWRETHARRRRMGLPADGNPRYGYDKLDDGTFALNAEEAPILAEMYRRYLRGEGFTRIVKWLNQSGHTTKAGGEWSRVTVTHMLDAGFGAGKIVHRVSRKDGNRDWKISASTYHDGAHDAVITPAEWDAYVAMRLDAPKPPQVIEPKYPLTGLIFCGDCGAPMHVGNQGLKDYKCSRAAKGSARGMFMTRALVEQVVREWIRDLAHDVDELAAAVARERERRVIQMDNVATLDRKIADVTDRLGRITVRWAAGNMPDAAYDAAVAQLDADLGNLRERRQRASPTPRLEIDPRHLAMNLDADWDDLTVLEQRNLLRALVTRVEIHRPIRQGTGVWRERVRIIPAWESPVG